MANGAIAQTSFTDGTAIQNSTPVVAKAIHVTELRTAITALQSYAANVDNCGNCTFCQSCQTTTCQTAACQSISCQSAVCQSVSCQSYSAGGQCVYAADCNGSSSTYNCWQCGSCQHSI